MVPRTVQMAKAVSDTLGPTLEAEYGNVLGPVCRKGWSNNFSEWFLGDLTTLGNPTMFSYVVHSWLGKAPRWAQRPQKKFDSPFGAIIHPVADSLTPPPLTVIDMGG